ncbi:hypothetical protein HY991_04520 [Candidatus Micrarchaeota archaeon]|nr:hypothetical protein [Candidatus Micrarchaeota archaeon]
MKKTKLSETMEKAIKTLDEQEKRQDKVLMLSREIIRDCAKAIKSIHSREMREYKQIASGLGKKIEEMKKIDKDFKHISSQCYQEYVEIRALEAVLEKKEIPSDEELGISLIPYLNGLADVTGELRRELQIALHEGKKAEAKYFFDKMNEIYENLMLLKYSSSLMGGLRRKQDVARGQIEQARSELLR